jgi:mRNA-degrading endonuclease YafQ of YafQ-DinJ toxin-antitoxin module
MGCGSIDITSDWRALYKEHSGVAYFVEMGTHSQLYK